MRSIASRILSLLMLPAVALGTQAGLCDLVSLLGMDPHPVECVEVHCCDTSSHEHGSHPCTEVCDSDVKVMAEPRWKPDGIPAAGVIEFEAGYSEFSVRWESAPQVVAYQEPPDLYSFLCSPAVTCRILI